MVLPSYRIPVDFSLSRKPLQCSFREDSPIGL
jgi:hypothetical protein